MVYMAGSPSPGLCLDDAEQRFDFRRLELRGTQAERATVSAIVSHKKLSRCYDKIERFRER